MTEPETTSSASMTDRERLYKSMDRHGRVKIRVPFNPMLLALLGQYNPLKPEDKPEMEEFEHVQKILNEAGLSYLFRAI